jgi:hypothetical protein
MSDFEFPTFSQPTEDARALLARLYRDIGVFAVATALDLDQAPEAPRAADIRQALSMLDGKAAAA